MKGLFKSIHTARIQNSSGWAISDHENDLDLKLEHAQLQVFSHIFTIFPSSSQFHRNPPPLFGHLVVLSLVKTKGSWGCVVPARQVAPCWSSWSLSVSCIHALHACACLRRCQNHLLNHVSNMFSVICSVQSREVRPSQTVKPWNPKEHHPK